MNRRVDIDNAPYAFGIEGDHVEYQRDEPIDESGEAEAIASQRQAQAEAFFWAVLAFPELSDQQRLVGLAKYFLLRYGEDAGSHATARFLNWDAKTGPPKVAEQWRRLSARLLRDTAIGAEWRSTPREDDDSAAA